MVWLPATTNGETPLFIREKSFSVLNTRKKKAIVTLEFRSRDYDGPLATRTGHKNFDRKFDVTDPLDKLKASEIISKIKQNYA